MGWFSNLFGGKKKETANSFTSGLKGALQSAGISSSMQKGRVNAKVLNARKEPDKKGKILYRLKKHTIINIKGDYDEWYLINTELGDAYCMKEYIDKIDVIEKLLVDAEVLNVRSFYSTDSTILGRVYKGNILVKLGTFNQWYSVDYKGRTGFVHGNYVTLLTDDTKTTNTTVPVAPKDEPRVFFHSRKDLAGVSLEPANKLSPEGQDKFGKVAVRTWNNYGNIIAVIANELGIEVEIALAVICVESGGNGFGSDGRMLIRFENHVFYTYFGDKSEEKQKIYDEHFSYNTKKRRDDHKYRAKKSDEWKTSHTGQDAEWEAFEIARSIAETEAMYSISMGAPQVMGFNFKMIGYNSVQDMFAAFCKDIRYHIMALFDFCNANGTRIQYLRTRDFLSFAKAYNGLTAPEAYEQRLQQYYDIYKKLLTKKVLA
ncbi:MAG: N-acetylmuramidase domain-containing protein [Bacteroidales bacterium]|nr:N-acetylmuramidase domain-containing protein [Bacteroidales bacterium]